MKYIDAITVFSHCIDYVLSDLPDLCADRIDYSFKHFTEYCGLNLERVGYCLNKLENVFVSL